MDANQNLTLLFTELSLVLCLCRSFNSVVKDYAVSLWATIPDYHPS